MQDFSDSELVDRSRQGDNEAFGMLVRRYLEALYHFVMRLSSNSHDAEDIVQATWIKVWKKLGRFDTHRAFKPWLYRIARNTFLDSIKGKKEIPVSVFDTAEGNYIEDTTADLTPGVEELFDKKLASRDLYAHIETLSPIYQVVVMLHTEEGLTFQEISEILDESIDTVKSRYRRACTKLKALIV